MKTRIAILVPAYNSASTIRETLLSIQRQTALCELAAVVVADDGSRDETVIIAENSWKVSIPLRVIRSECNRGERTNVNEAVSTIASEADWFLILHADDVAKPYWLELMLNEIRSCPDSVASICSSWDDWMPDGSMIWGEDNPSRAVEFIEGSRDAVRSTLFRGCWWHISGCAIRAKAFSDVGPFDSDMPQLGDIDWLLRCLKMGWAIAYIPRTLILYRQHPSSVSSLSFQTDRDIRESLVIIMRYRAALNAVEIVRWHARRLNTCARRMLRAMVNRRPARVFQASRTAYVVAKNLIFTFRRG